MLPLWFLADPHDRKRNGQHMDWLRLCSFNVPGGVKKAKRMFLIRQKLRDSAVLLLQVTGQKSGGKPLYHGRCLSPLFECVGQIII